MLYSLAHRLRSALASHKRSRGALGESLAADHLRRAGYRVLLRNWRHPEDRRLELDIVAREGDTLVFIEVKTLSSEALQTGRSKLDRRKRAALLRATTAYLGSLKARPPHRTDLIEVYLDSVNRPVEVMHLQNLNLKS